MTIKIRTIIFGIIGLIIMILGFYSFIENLNSWRSMFVFVGGIVILIALFFEPTDYKLEIKNEA